METWPTCEGFVSESVCARETDSSCNACFLTSLCMRMMRPYAKYARVPNVQTRLVLYVGKATTQDSMLLISLPPSKEKALRYLQR